MTSPSEKHMEESAEICSRITEFGEPAQDVIAAALASAERMGMYRAARLAGIQFSHGTAAEAAGVIAAAILSEAGEGE